MFLKPVTGRTVPDPERGDALPVEGREVVENQYWYRRVQDGDVVAVVAPITVTLEAK
jgi:hypothetical protein